MKATRDEHDLMGGGGAAEELLLARLRLVLDWTNAAHAGCAADRWVLHEELMARPGKDVSLCVEVAWGSVAPTASRIVRRGCKEAAEVLAEIRALPSLLDQEEVRLLYARDGLTEYKRHVETVELLRCVLIQVLEKLAERGESSAGKR
jgi:hypothetical protein